MLEISQATQDIINSPVREIKARVELYTSTGIETEEEAGSTLANTFTHDGALKEFKVDRVGDESKFFGFGVFQKINVKIIDVNKELDIKTSDYLKVVYTVGEEELTPYPFFKVSETHRDEVTNELSITGYDLLDGFKNSVAPVEELRAYIDNYVSMYGDISLATIMSKFVELVGFEVDINTVGDYMFMDYTSSEEINLDGTETIKEILDAIAEFSHSIYFINGKNNLVFESLYEYGPMGVEYLDKSKYFELETRENRRLSTVIHTTELGNNVSTPATTGNNGTTQFLKDNPFIDKDETKTATILNDIIDNLGDFTINQFECSWRGNPAVEPLDKLVITTRDGSTVESFVINDTVEYNGAFSQTTSWSYQESDNEESGEPTTLGEALKMTQAKVDKANQEISLVVRSTNESLAAANEKIDELYDEVALRLDAEAVKIEVTKALENINGVTTTTGFTFNEEGLTVSKSDTDITTTITEKGMTVKQGEDEKLVANQEGVKAEDLHATTYLIIGNTSRFEDYKNANGVTKTACFWIGG